MTVKKVEEDEDESTTRCGLFNWRPQWLQRFATPKAYLVLYSAVGIIQGMSYTYGNAVLSTMERQFGLKSKETAWIFSGNEIASVLFIGFMPFVGRIKRRPLFMGMALAASGLGIALMSLPILTSRRAEKVRIDALEQFGEKQQPLCGADSDSDVDKCNADASYVGKDYAALIITFCGMFIAGIGSSFYYIVGLPYGDDNTKKDDSPMMIAIIWASRLLGPALGFMLGAACLRVYVKPWALDEIDFGERDPQWIGAWWLGFPIIGLVLIFVAPWVALFPRRLVSEHTDAAKLEEAEKLEDKTDLSAKDFFLDMLKMYRRLAAIKLYVFNVFSIVFAVFGMIGFATFLPKYYEYHYRQPPSRAGALGGAFKSASAVLGCLVCGAVVSKFKFEARTLAGWNMFCSFSCSAVFIIFMFLACPKLEMFGLEGDANSEMLVRSCNVDCDCDFAADYRPICSGDGVTNFFSPCQAGCKFQEGKFYGDCSCANLTATSPRTWDGNEDLDIGLMDATDGYCTADCETMFYTVLILLGIASFITATNRMPNALIMLRAISPQDKAASMSFIIGAISLFSFLPTPFFYAALLDNSCVLWNVAETCDGEQETLNCHVYDTDKMRYLLNGATAFFLFLAGLCDTAVFILAKDLKLYDQEEADRKIAEVAAGETNKAFLENESEKETEEETKF